MTAENSKISSEDENFPFQAENKTSDESDDVIETIDNNEESNDETDTEDDDEMDEVVNVLGYKLLIMELIKHRYNASKEYNGKKKVYSLRSFSLFSA